MWQDCSLLGEEAPMTECPHCSARVRSGQEECENCGFPLDAAKPRLGRETRIDASPSPQEGLYRPSGRKTRIEGPPAATAPVPAPSPADPFARALTPSGTPRPRRTVIGAAAASDPFAAALSAPPAGAPEPLERPLAGVLISFSGAPNGRVMPLTLGRTVLGRDPGPPGPDTLVIPDDSISARHCVLVAREAGVMVRDEMSSNGTLLRSSTDAAFRDILAETVQLSDGDQLKLGDTILLLRLLDRSAIPAIWGPR
jgi:hypothetical protein